MNKENIISRRKAVQGISAGIATLAITPALGGASLHTTGRDMPIMEDPTKKYPHPPFESQSQPWPGLANKMNPKPDHGESSYKGSGRLAGRKALITGGDSG